MTLIIFVSVSLILLGAMAIAISIRKACRIWRVLRDEPTAPHWQILISLMVSFLLGYCLAMILVLNQVWTWLTLLTGVVFCLGSCFVLFSISIMGKTIEQLLSTRISRQQYQQAQAETQQTLQDLRKTQAQLIQAEKMVGLGQIAAGIAHEINNPVNFIWGNLTPLQDYTQDLLAMLATYERYYPSPHPEIVAQRQTQDFTFLQTDLPNVVSSMESGVIRIQKIVDALKTFSHLGESIEKEIDLNQEIDNTLILLQHQLCDPAIRPAIQVVKQYGNLPHVKCRARDINQVFMHLLCNAIDALRSDQIPEPTLWIRTAFLEQNQVRISIQDNALGMEADIQRRIFEPFFTTKPVGKGTGLGLSVSYQIIVEQHGGTLTCHSQINQGTEFIMTLPVHRN